MPPDTQIPPHIENSDTRIVLRAVAAMGEQIKGEQSRRHSENAADIVSVKAALQELREDLRNAFPGGDIHGHRRYHDTVIEWRELRNKMLREVLVGIAKFGTLGLVVWIGVALWKAFVFEVLKK